MKSYAYAAPLIFRSTQKTSMIGGQGWELQGTNRKRMTVNAEDRFDETALMNAAKLNENLEVITTLIKAGADINTQDNLGKTALMHAADFSRKPDVITTLIKAGIDFNTQNKIGLGYLMNLADLNQNLEV
jgi:ankyrin repeat protein